MNRASLQLADQADTGPMGMTGLSVDRLDFAFASPDGAKQPIFRGFSLEVAPGEVTAILGRSGCGKSTLLNILAGAVSPDAGELRFAGLPLAEVRSAGEVSYLDQKPLLLPWLTVMQNLEAPARLVGRSLDQGAAQLLTALGLAGAGDSFPNTLSGGMYQRAALARALYVKPSLLLLDEPFSALDEITRIDAYATLREVIEAHGVCCVLVTHDIAEMVTAADNCVAITGSPAEIALQEDVSGLRDMADGEAASLRARILDVLG